MHKNNPNYNFSREKYSMHLYVMWPDSFESRNGSSNVIRSYERGESNKKQLKICSFKLHFILQMDHFVIDSWKANKFHLCLFQCNTTLMP